MKNQDLLTQFRACGKLLNYWRDTLGYASLVAVETVVAIKTGQPFQLTEIPLWLGVRELGRYAAWQFGKNSLAVGHAGTAQHPDRLAHHALTVAMSGMAVKFISTAFGQATLQDPSNSLSLVAGTAFGAVASLLYARGDGLKNIIQAYDNVMWDYPRKSIGGGSNQKLPGARQLALG